MDNKEKEAPPHTLQSFEDVSAKELHEGKMNWKEISVWFGLNPNSLTKNPDSRQKKLDILKLYADFHIETTGKSGKKTCVIIDKVKIPVYTKARELVQQDTEKYRQPLDTATRIGREIQKKNSIVRKSLKVSTTIEYVGDDLKNNFGRLYDRRETGIKGDRYPVWAEAIKNQNGEIDHYRLLTDEEISKVIEAKKEAGIEFDKDGELSKAVVGQMQYHRHLSLEEKAAMFDQAASQISEAKYKKFMQIAKKKLGFSPRVVSKFEEYAWNARYDATNDPNKSTNAPKTIENKQ